MNKKGLSPIVATALLVALALILALIIFFAARSFIKENVEKDGRAVELSCADINFNAEASYNSVSELVTLNVGNSGNIPLYGVEVKKKGSSSITGSGSFSKTISVGDSSEISGINVGRVDSAKDELIVSPVILGKLESGETKPYTCEDKALTIGFI